MSQRQTPRHPVDGTTKDCLSLTSGQYGPDVYHVYIRHDDVAYFLTLDGTFVPDLAKGHGFHDIQDAFDVVNRMTEGRDLSSKEEPGVVANAWKWVGSGTAAPA